jgi:hypothetical protein
MGGVSPLLAYVLSLLDGKQGIAGWEWIFVSNYCQQTNIGRIPKFECIRSLRV